MNNVFRRAFLLFCTFALASLAYAESEDGREQDISKKKPHQVLSVEPKEDWRLVWGGSASLAFTKGLLPLDETRPQFSDVYYVTFFQHANVTWKKAWVLGVSLSESLSLGRDEGIGSVLSGASFSFLVRRRHNWGNIKGYYGLGCSIPLYKFSRKRTFWDLSGGVSYIIDPVILGLSSKLRGGMDGGKIPNLVQVNVSMTTVINNRMSVFFSLYQSFYPFRTHGGYDLVVSLGLSVTFAEYTRLDMSLDGDRRKILSVSLGAMRDMRF